MLRPALAALLATTTAASAQQGGGLGTYLELLDPDRLAQRALQSGILALRTRADVVYDAISVSLVAGEVAITGLDVWPLPEWDEAVECRFSADRIAITTAPVAEIDRIALRAVVTGMTVPEACLPPDQRMPLAMTGLSEIVVPRMTVSVDYDIPSSGLSMRAHAEVSELATLDAEAEFTYAWFDAREDPDNPVPVLFLSEARVSLENGGGWEAIRGLLPPPAAAPESAALVAEGLVGSVLSDMNASSGGLRGESDPALSDAQRAFVSSAAEAWASFVADPRRLVIETGIDGDIYVDIEAYAEDPRIVFDDLALGVDTLASAARDVVPTELLRAAYDAPESLTDGQRRRIARALATGEGAPRNLGVAVDLVSDLAEGGDAAASLLVARALEDRDPAGAYARALTASAARLDGSTALLDRLEGELPLADVIAAQTAAAGEAALPADAASDIAAARANALRHLSGRGAVRSFELASLWARLGAASGDGGSVDILEQIDARVAADPGAFDAAERRAAAAATEAWLSRE